MTMANIDSTSKRVDDPGLPNKMSSKRVDDPGLPNKRRVRRERKPSAGRNSSTASSAASTAVQNTGKGSILWTLLLAGLVFSLIDLFYIANYLERAANVQSFDPIIKPSVFLIPSGLDSSKDEQKHSNPESSSNIEHPSSVRTMEKLAGESKNQAKGPIHISTPKIKPSAVRDANSRKFNHLNPGEPSSDTEHAITGHSVEKPKDESKAQRQATGPIHMSTPSANVSAFSSINEMDSPKDEPPRLNPEELSSEHGEHATIGRSLEKPKDDGKDQAQASGPIHMSTPLANSSAFSSTDELDIPKDEPPRPNPNEPSSDTEHAIPGRTLEQPNDVSKDQAKGAIIISAPLATTSAFSSTDEMNNPKDDPPRPEPKEPSLKQGEPTTTAHSMEQPKDVSKDKDQAKGPILISVPVANTSAFSRINEMNSPKDEPPRPHPEESSSERGEHTTTGHSTENPKGDGKDQAERPIQISTPILKSSASQDANSRKFNHPNPGEPSSDTEHAITGHSTEKPKGDGSDQDKESIQISAPLLNASAFSSTYEMDNDKGPILLLLEEAGIDLDGLDQSVLDSLPLWSTVVKLYGDQPRIVGLDTCEAFQATGDPADHFLGVAGTFNTGTNLMAELFIANCHMPARMAKYGKVNRGIRWQVRYVAELSPTVYNTLHHTSFHENIVIMVVTSICLRHHGRNCNSHFCHYYLKGTLGQAHTGCR
jgi:hypothetical protein